MIEDYDLACLQNFFNLQSGGGDVPFFAGRMMSSDYNRRGSGLGGLLGKAAKLFLPMAKKGLREISRSGLQVASDVLGGQKNLKTALADRGKELAARGIKRGLSHLDSTLNSQTNSPPKRKKKRRTVRKRNIF